MQLLAALGAPQRHDPKEEEEEEEEEFFNHCL